MVIMGKKNDINLHLAAFVTVFAHHLVHAYKLRIIQKHIFQIFLWKVIKSSFKCKFISFSSCAHAYEN